MSKKKVPQELTPLEKPAEPPKQQVKEFVITSREGSRKSLPQFQEDVTKMIAEYGEDAIVTEVRLVIVKVDQPK